MPLNGNCSTKKLLQPFLLCVKPSQLNYIKNCITASDAWRKLKEVYKPSGPLRKVSLYKKLLALRFSDSISMTQYINTFLEITSNLSEVGILLHDELLVIILLSSLPKEFENFVIAMETRDNLPTLEVLKLKLLEESMRRSQQDEKEDVVGTQQAFMARSSMQSKVKNNNNNNYNNSNKTNSNVIIMVNGAILRKIVEARQQRTMKIKTNIEHLLCYLHIKITDLIRIHGVLTAARPHTYAANVRTLLRLSNVKKK